MITNNKLFTVIAHNLNFLWFKKKRINLAIFPLHLIETFYL